MYKRQPYSRTDDTLTGDGDAAYRVVSEDTYGARTEGASAPCVGSDAADEGTDTGGPTDTGGGADTGDDTDTTDPIDSEEDASEDELDSDDTVDGDSEDTVDSDKGSGGCATGAAPLAVGAFASLLLVGRRRP